MSRPWGCWFSCNNFAGELILFLFEKFLQIFVLTCFVLIWAISLRWQNGGKTHNIEIPLTLIMDTNKHHTNYLWRKRRLIKMESSRSEKWIERSFSWCASMCSKLLVFSSCVSLCLLFCRERMLLVFYIRLFFIQKKPFCG